MVTVSQKSPNSSIGLSVSTAGMVVTLTAGTLKVAGEDLEVLEDQTYTCSVDATYDHDISGWIVREISSGDIVLLVDDVALDGIDSSANLVNDPTYETLWLMFDLHIPATTSDLAGIAINRYVASLET